MPTRLCKDDEMSARESALSIPVPEAEPVVGQHRFKLDDSARLGVPAHITVLYPWMPPDEIDDSVRLRLAQLFDHQPVIDYVLAEVKWFGDDVVYAAPVPDEPFRNLTRLVAAEWPAFPPYGGEHGEPTPHLTIGDSYNDATRDDLATAGAAVEARLPIVCKAHEIWLMSGDSELGWRRDVVYRFGG